MFSWCRRIATTDPYSVLDYIAASKKPWARLADLRWVIPSSCERLRSTRHAARSTLLMDDSSLACAAPSRAAPA